MAAFATSALIYATKQQLRILFNGMWPTSVVVTPHLVHENNAHALKALTVISCHHISDWFLRIFIGIGFAAANKILGNKWYKLRHRKKEDSPHRRICVFYTHLPQWTLPLPHVFCVRIVSEFKKLIPWQLVEFQGIVCVLAERTRFELVVGLLLRQFSKLVVSATHPPLQ